MKIENNLNNENNINPIDNIIIFNEEQKLFTQLIQGDVATKFKNKNKNSSHKPESTFKEKSAIDLMDLNQTNKRMTRTDITKAAISSTENEKKEMKIDLISLDQQVLDDTANRQSKKPNRNRDNNSNRSGKEPKVQMKMSWINSITSKIKIIDNFSLRYLTHYRRKQKYQRDGETTTGKFSISNSIAITTRTTVRNTTTARISTISAAKTTKTSTATTTATSKTAKSTKTETRTRKRTTTRTRSGRRKRTSKISKTTVRRTANKFQF